MICLIFLCSEQCRFKSAYIFALSYHNSYKLTEASNKHNYVSTCTCNIQIPKQLHKLYIIHRVGERVPINSCNLIERFGLQYISCYATDLNKGVAAKLFVFIISGAP